MTAGNNADAKPAQADLCPRCERPARQTSENQYRPFCSETCQLVDLGAWFEGRYRIPAQEHPLPEFDHDGFFDDSLARPFDGPCDGGGG